ncbi:transketolase [soil metagenome]
MKNTTDLQELTRLIRYDIVTMTTQAGSGHPSSSLSAVELMTTLFFDGYLHYDFENPHYIFNDRLIFSKGHASPLFYAMYHAAGQLKYDELLTLRQFDSVLEGHPTPRFKFVDVSTGSLGQGLSVGVGMALGIKLQMKRTKEKLEREPHVWVLLGDSEVAEGQVWEAMQLASHYKLNNLIGFLDVNRLGQRGATMLEWDLETYEKRISAFGWNTILVENGNDLEEVREAFKKIQKDERPTMFIAKTKKGAGISSIADKDGWHGKPLTKEMLIDAIKEIGDVDTDTVGQVNEPKKLVIANEVKQSQINEEIAASLIAPRNDNKIMATREAYGEALKMIATDTQIVALDAETSNSTFAEKMKEADPERFFEMYIAEQNMISVAVGMSKVGFIPYATSFAAFLSRAYDQIRMAQYSDANIKIVGSHAGVSIGVDGSSQMALEDIAMMRGLLHSVILYPSDAVSTLRLVDEMRRHEGISYLRLTREKTPILYSHSEEFPIGGSKILKSSSEDKAVIVTAGITIHEALKAYEHLKQDGLSIAIIDAYSIKPLDAKTIQQYARRTGHVIVVEDHYPDGGLGDTVHRALDGLQVKFTHLAVNKIPRSGSPEELLHYEEIDTTAIVKAVKSM